MLNIENYNQWAKVCDDDELILELYNSGIRPGTDEFKKLLGEAYEGKTADFMSIVILVGGIGITVLTIVGSIKLIKFGNKKLIEFISKKISEKEGSQV